MTYIYELYEMNSVLFIYIMLSVFLSIILSLFYFSIIFEIDKYTPSLCEKTKQKFKPLCLFLIINNFKKWSFFGKIVLTFLMGCFFIIPELVALFLCFFVFFVFNLLKFVFIKNFTFSNVLEHTFAYYKKDSNGIDLKNPLIFGHKLKQRKNRG